MSDINDKSYMNYLKTSIFPNKWCPGCGNGEVLHAIANAFATLDLDPTQIVMVSGIGCWGKADEYMNTHAFHGTHGRALAYATGIKLANPALTVVVCMGDGDGVTIGGNHFIHAARRNVDLTAILSNNFNYGMTGGQYSGTTPTGSITTTSRYRHIERGFDVSALAKAAGATFVARSLSMEVPQTTNYIVKGIQHKGFSLIEVMNSCHVHYGHNNGMQTTLNVMKWLKERRVTAAQAAKMTEEELKGKIITGILFEDEQPDYGSSYEALIARAMQ